MVVGGRLDVIPIVVLIVYVFGRRWVDVIRLWADPPLGGPLVAFRWPVAPLRNPSCVNRRTAPPMRPNSALPPARSDKSTPRSPTRSLSEPSSRPPNRKGPDRAAYALAARGSCPPAGHQPAVQRCACRKCHPRCSGPVAAPIIDLDLFDCIVLPDRQR